jgi:putative transposase
MGNSSIGADKLPVRQKLERWYGHGHFHFITCSCYRRLPLLGTVKARDRFVKILSEVRDRYDFWLVGYVVMPEHIHLLISEPNVGDPSVVVRVLKQRVSRSLRAKKRRSVGQKELWPGRTLGSHPQFWQRRFYDFNVWSKKKRNEKLKYIHFNPVKRGLVPAPKDWSWSSYRFYWRGERGVCVPNPEWLPKSLRNSMKNVRFPRAELFLDSQKNGTDSRDSR